MKFIVTRASQHREDESAPTCHPKLKPESIPFIDRRCVNNPKYIECPDSDSPTWWYDEGANHRLIEGQIARDLEPQILWTIEINTLEELVQFWDSCKQEIILRRPSYYSINREIKIYDDYIE